jgi:proteasome accessory factor A
MGTETEFGISVQGQPTAHPMVASSQVVNAYASSNLRARRARWDFEEESPLRDARGFDMSRESADPSQLTDEDLGLANVILTNGARLYVDHAHPEYSTPECTNPRDVLKWDKAGELVALDATRFAATIPGTAPGTCCARTAAVSMTRSPALSHSTRSRGPVTSGVEYSGWAWST